MRYNTGNPVEPDGSSDPRDLYDNAANVDIAVNAQVPTWVDRLGVVRKSWAGMEEDFLALLANSGFELPPLEYVDGSPLTVDRPTQLIDRAGVLYGVKLPSSFPTVLSGNWVTDQPLLVARNDEALRSELAAANGSMMVGHKSDIANSVARTVQGAIRDAVVSDGDFSSVSAAFSNIGYAPRPLSLGGRTVTLNAVPANAYGTRIRDGKLLIPSRIAGQVTQVNTYADDVNGLMIGRENLACFWQSSTANALQNIYLYGDSTVEMSPAFPLRAHDLFQRALQAAGVNGTRVFNRGASGTSWTDFSPTAGDIGPATRLIGIKYGINDATKGPNSLQIMRDAIWSKLTALRAMPYGNLENLSILLIGPSSTYRPSQNQDAKWYESLRNIYLQACKEFNCAYFDTYAYLQDTSRAPGFWQDNIGGTGEGLHPDPVAVYWIWYEGIKNHVLGDGQWNIQKSNQFWNLTNYTRVSNNAVTPAGYDYGLIVEAAFAANGFPFDGILTTIRHADGVALQRLQSQDVVPRTAERRGGGAVWTQWTGRSNAITPLNSWANKGGGYAPAGYQVGADGFVDLFGCLAGGAANSTAFNLPANARPDQAHEFRLASSGAGTLFADGNFNVVGATSGLLSLDGIRFRVRGAI